MTIPLFIKTRLALLTLVATLLSSSAYAEFFIYKENDGTNWITDRRLPTDKYTLIATIGRPTAFSSCRGVTDKIMEERASTHHTTIKNYATAYNIDPHLIKAIIRVESCFDRYAVSRVGAQGLMQLMPGTAKKMGVNNVFNAVDNIRGGVKHFALMLERFQNNSELALAAYNAGPEAVVKYGGIPPYRETKDYAGKVLKYYQKYSLAKTDLSS